MVTNLDKTVNITKVTELFLHICFDMSSVEQTSTKGISFTFPVMSSVPSTDKSNFVQNPLATITGHVQVHNPAPNIAVNQQQAEITQIAPKPLSAIPMLHETLEKMMSKMTQIENTMSQMQVNVPVSNLQYFQLPICLRDHPELC